MDPILEERQNAMLATIGSQFGGVERINRLHALADTTPGYNRAALDAAWDKADGHAFARELTTLAAMATAKPSTRPADPPPAGGLAHLATLTGAEAKPFESRQEFRAAQFAAERKHGTAFADSEFSARVVATTKHNPSIINNPLG